MTFSGSCGNGGVREMPFLISRVNVPLSRKQEMELKVLLGRAIELVPGKSEAYLLLCFEDNCRLWLRGDDSAPIAYIEANIFANERHAGYDAFTHEVTRIFHQVLGIGPDHIYLHYTDIPDWGVGGLHFDRRAFR